MKRKTFLKSLAVMPAIGVGMNLQALSNFASNLSSTEKMPALFLGHGSPMNAIAENEYVANFRKLGRELTKPKAILCISAHWETRGTYVTAMENPRTIHDFGGFPQALFDVQYPVQGHPELAEETKSLVTTTDVQLDDKWGLDHGSWSVIKHLYPDADVPVIQMSIDRHKTPKAHYELARELGRLRRKGVLIVGSGNMVHNLRMVDWKRLNDNYGYDWTLEVNESMKGFINGGDHQSLIDFRAQGTAFNLAIPTPEHYLPLLYTLGLQEDTDEVQLFNDQAVGGSVTMTSVKIA